MKKLRIACQCFMFIICTTVQAQYFEPFEENGKWGYRDLNKKVIIQPKYEAAQSFDDDLAIIKLNGKYGYINRKGIEIGKIIYEEAKEFTSEVAVVKLNNKYGMINKKGSPTTKFIYDYILSTYGKHKGIPASIDGKWGVIDDHGKTLLDFDYDFAAIPSDGYFPVIKDGNAGFVDAKGNTLIPFEYTETYRFNNGLAEVWKDTLIGMINKKNEIIVPIMFQDVVPIYKSNYISVYLNDSVGFYNTRGKQLTTCKYTSCADQVGDLLYVIRDEKSGLIDSTGKEVLPCEYDYIGYDYGICYIVTKNEKYGLFNSQLKKLVTDPIYEYIWASDDLGFYQVSSGSNNGLLNSQGQLIIPMEYYEITINKKKKRIYASKYEGQDIYTLDGKLITQ